MKSAFARSILSLAMASAAFTSAHAEDQPAANPEAVQTLEEVSVTATREKRPTRDVPQAISVISEQKIEDSKMFNIKDALQGTPGVLIDSKNGGSDARLIVRGAGLKAPYGIREIMVVRDGVPMTDPDSFTRLDFIDTQDIERIEVAKGPGNLYSTGSAGGAIHIISKSVFDERADSLRLGLGNEGAQNLHLRYGEKIGEDQAMALTFSHRALENDWRAWNKFDTQQLGVKHGLTLGANATLETELSYSQSDLQLPGSMSVAQFETFKDTGEQTATKDAWKHSGRYSKILFFNTKYEKEDGAVTWKPRFYYTQWTHYHPVTAFINETQDWVQTYGTDLEGHYRHEISGHKATLVAGVTLRVDDNNDSRKYRYRDYTTGFGGRITATLSDEKGALANTSSSINTLYGVFMQESVRFGDRWLVDAGFRLDRARFRIDENEITKFNYTTGVYEAGDGLSSIDKSYTLPAPKLGASYRLNNTTSVFASVAQASQVPSESEISGNTALDSSTSTNYEVGLKGRAARWAYDLSVYFNPVRDEIITVYQDLQSVYLNAGETDKKGLEFSGSFRVTDHFDLGMNYAYSVYRYRDFIEPVTVSSVTTNYDRSGNFLPYIPKHQYGVFTTWRHASGVRVRLETNSWDSYYLDNANSEKYEGYDWVTSLMLAYEKGAHLVAFNVDNLFDKHYAMEVKKDTRGTVSYTAASPRSYLLSYRYNF